MTQSPILTISSRFPQCDGDPFIHRHTNGRFVSLLGRKRARLWKIQQNVSLTNCSPAISGTIAWCTAKQQHLFLLMMFNHANDIKIKHLTKQSTSTVRMHCIHIVYVPGLHLTCGDMNSCISVCHRSPWSLFCVCWRICVISRCIARKICKQRRNAHNYVSATSLLLRSPAALCNTHFWWCNPGYPNWWKQVSAVNKWWHFKVIQTESV